MGLVHLVSELADRLQKDAKRLAEEKEKIQQSIESLLELLKLDDQRDGALHNLQEAYSLSQTVQDSINLMARDAAQLFASQKVKSLLNIKDVNKNPLNSRHSVLSYVNASCPPEELPDLMSTVKVVLQNLVERHFPAAYHCRVLRLLGLSPLRIDEVPNQHQYSDAEDEKEGSRNKRKTVWRKCPWCTSERVRSLDPGSSIDNNGSDNVFHLPSSESAEMQEQLYKYLIGSLQAIISDAPFTGYFDFNVLNIGEPEGTLERVEEYNFLRDRVTGSSTTAKLLIMHVNRGVSWTKAIEKFQLLVGAHEGFYLSYQVRNSRLTPILAIASNKLRTEEKDTLYTVYRPNTGPQAQQETLEMIQKKYRKVSKDEAEPHWTQHYDFSKETCSHAYWQGLCKNVSSGLECDIGVHHRRYSVLAGCVLSLWPEAENLLSSSMGHYYEKIQIVRLCAYDRSKIIIGTLIPNKCVEDLKKALEEDSVEMEEAEFE